MLSYRPIRMLTQCADDRCTCKPPHCCPCSAVACSARLFVTQGKAFYPTMVRDGRGLRSPINLVGAFILGALLEGLARSGDDTAWRRRARLFAGTGFCGALTTYSTFAFEISLLGKGSHLATAVGYGLGSVVGGVIAAWLGIVMAADIHRRRVHS